MILFPLYITSPFEGSSIPARILIKVDLPHPEGPDIPIIPFSGKEKETLFDKIYESVKRNIKTSYVNPSLIVMDKIICGDAGDNIQSVATVKKNSRNFKVTSKVWDGIRNSLHINNLNMFFNNTDNIINSILNNNKFSVCKSSDLSDMIRYNTKLVWLNESVIPETIILYMNQCEYKVVDISYIRSNYKTMCENNSMIENIFESI